MRIVLTSILLGAVFAACSPSASPRSLNGVSLRASPDQPSPGSNVTLTLRNDTTEAIGYNLCTSTLSRGFGDSWEPVPSDRVCTMELRLLAPGREDTFTHELPGDLAPGNYRFSTRVERSAAGFEEVATPPFSIGG